MFPSERRRHKRSERSAVVNFAVESSRVDEQAPAPNSSTIFSIEVYLQKVDFKIVLLINLLFVDKKRTQIGINSHGPPSHPET